MPFLLIRNTCSGDHVYIGRFIYEHWTISSTRWLSWRQNNRWIKDQQESEGLTPSEDVYIILRLNGCVRRSGRVSYIVTMGRDHSNHHSRLYFCFFFYCVDLLGIVFMDY
ncbi:hypothetical protein LguiA_025694 [Lonicera macranthoides]